MSAISTRQPEVTVAYDTKSGRKSKFFSDARKARAFYTRQFNAGNKPEIVRSEEMPATPKAATRKSGVPKKPAKKAPTKKVPKKPVKKATAKKVKKSTKTTSNGYAKPDSLRRPQIAILQAISKSKNGLTRTEISSVVPGNLSEHLGSTRANAKPNKYTTSLLEWKYVKAEQNDENGKDVIRYILTALGRKQLQKVNKA